MQILLAISGVIERFISGIGKLAACEPTTLASMHGSAWTGDGAALLRELGGRLFGD